MQGVNGRAVGFAAVSVLVAVAASLAALRLRLRLPQTIRVWQDDAELYGKMEARARLSLQPWSGRRFSVADVKSNAANHPHIVLAAIVDQKLYVDANSSMDIYKDKLSGWYDQLVQVLQWWEQRDIRIPNCLFTIHFRSSPIHTAHPLPSAPSFALATSPDYREVPVPNPYFLTHERWAGIRTQLLTLARAQPFGQRRGVGFFRGACMNYPGSLPRVELASIESPLLDVGFFGGCLTPSWDEAPPEIAAKARKVPGGQFAYFDEFVRNKYLIHMPGGLNASYSRTLQFTLGLGGVILKWDNPYEEFYYDWLEEGKHFVTVNATTIVPTIERLNADPALAQRMAEDTTQWFERHLHADFLQQYWWHLLTQYSAMQDFKPSLAMLQTPCACGYAYKEWKDRSCASFCQYFRHFHTIGLRYA